MSIIFANFYYGPTFIDVSLKFNCWVSQKKYTKLVKHNLKLIMSIILD